MAQLYLLDQPAGRANPDTMALGLPYDWDTCRIRKMDSVHAAAKRGDLAAVRNMVRENSRAVMDKDPDFGTTALHWAAKANHLQLAEFLLSARADVDAADSSGRTPLQWLLVHHQNSARHRAMFELLLSAGAEHTFETALRHGTPSHVSSWLDHVALDEPVLPGASALAFAAEVAQLPVVELLLQRGLPVGGTDYDEQSPLVRAINASRRDVAELLLAKGANPEQADSNGVLPIDVATEHFTYSHDMRAIIELLVQYGAHITPQWAAVSNDIALLATALEHWPVDRLGYRRKTALCIAAQKPSAEMVAQLLAHEANPNLADDEGQTPLHLVAPPPFFQRHEPNASVAKMLLDAGADPNARDHAGRTPLHSALKLMHSSGVNLILLHLLVDAGADLDARDNRGRLPTEQPGEIHVSPGDDGNEIFERYRATVQEVKRIISR